MKIQVYCAYDKIVKLSSLIPHPMNPNIHPQDQIDKLGKLIKYHGWRKPVTVSNRSGYVIRGHGRVLAAQKEGILDVPVNYQDYDSDDQELADLVADNKVSEYSELDEDLSMEILDTLGGSGFDLELTGFDIGVYEKSRNSASDRGRLAKIPGSLVELPYIFKKDDRDRIMKILNRGDDPAKMLMQICRKMEALYA